MTLYGTLTFAKSVWKLKHNCFADLHKARNMRHASVRGHVCASDSQSCQPNDAGGRSMMTSQITCAQQSMSLKHAKRTC